MIAAILFVSFAILLILGAPIAVCLGSSSVLAMLAQGGSLSGIPRGKEKAAFPRKNTKKLL